MASCPLSPAVSSVKHHGFVARAPIVATIAGSHTQLAKGENHPVVLAKYNLLVEHRKSHRRHLSVELLWDDLWPIDSATRVLSIAIVHQLSHSGNTYASSSSSRTTRTTFLSLF